VYIIDGLNPYWSNLLKKRLLKSLSDVSDRVKVLPRMDNDGYSQLMVSADIVLDTPHFSGGLTSLEAFAAETPIVTIPGKFMRGRVTLAIYRQMGILDCVVDDLEEYVDVATRLCLDQNFREVVSSKIREGHDRIFDNRKTIDKHARIFEKAMFET
jgi:predicted O-linked N-acetylglucosamine transferase (SPINDLY family)